MHKLTLASFPGHRFCCSHWERELTRSHPPLPQTMQVASVPLGLVSTQAPQISHSTHSAKLQFFQKAGQSSWLSNWRSLVPRPLPDLSHRQLQDKSWEWLGDEARIHVYSNYEEQKEGGYARDELNIQANAFSPLLSKCSVQKAYFQELTGHVTWQNCLNQVNSIL